MKWRLKLSSIARRDIDDALQWTLDNYGQKKQDQYVELIGLALTEIVNNPHTPRGHKRPSLHRDARTFHIGRRGKHARHLFVYRIGKSDAIEVARFLHDTADFPAHLPDEFL